MPNVVMRELGIAVELIDPPMVTVRGHVVPDVNLRQLADSVFASLVQRPSRLTGDEVRFIRKHQRLRQADLARVLNMANHSVVSQWESRGEEAAGMDYNTEVLLRIWMAGKVGQAGQVVDLLEHGLKDLKPASTSPVVVRLMAAA